jgi:hypothetical protein
MKPQWRLTVTLDATLTKYADTVAAEVLERIRSQVEAGIVAITTGKAVRFSRRGSGHVMDCRVSGCKQRSKGPRFGYMCETHRSKLSKAEQQKAREQWNAKRASA